MALAPQEVRTFFVTSVSASRRRIFQVERNANLLIDVLLDNREKGRFKLHGFVVMPDHIHLILTPAPVIFLEKAMQYIKGGFSFRLKSKMDVWERSFTEHRIKNAADFKDHLIYMEENPVQAHLVDSAGDFPFSSAAVGRKLDPAPVHLAGGCQG